MFAGNMWRSEPMTYVRITMPREAVRTAVEKLGDAGKMEFVDVSIAHAKAYLLMFFNIKS